nr:hypothetical protein [Tanacetum cinerariifolium]
MELDLEARLMEETLVLNRSLNPLDGDYIELNDLNEPIELRRNQGNDSIPTIEEDKVIKEFRTRDDELDFAVLEDMDAYRDKGMGGVIFGEPFLKEIRIKARRFEGMITIYNGNNEVTYLMSYQIKVNLTAPTLTFSDIEAHEPYSVVDKPSTGLIYLNSKDEKWVTYLTETVKFCDATLEKVLKERNNQVTKSPRANEKMGMFCEWKTNSTDD